MAASTVLVTLLAVASIGLLAVYYSGNVESQTKAMRINCSNWDGENSCKGSQTENPTEWSNRNF